VRILKDTKYSYLYSNYKRKNKRGRILLLAGIGLSILGSCLATLTVNPSGIGWWLLFLGLLCGSWGGQELASSLNYMAGIEGERAVVEALQELDDSYCLINDIMAGRGRGNIDHILLGPKGIFVIETKNYSGDVRCDGNRWRKKGKRRLYDIPSVSNQAKNNAKYLSDLIRKKTNLGIFIDPICVFTNPYVELKLHRPAVTVLRLTQLAEFIRQVSPMTTLTDSEIQAISRCILGKHLDSPS
jgi:hypothetical protein